MVDKSLGGVKAPCKVLTGEEAWCCGDLMQTFDAKSMIMDSCLMIGHELVSDGSRGHHMKDNDVKRSSRWL